MGVFPGAVGGRGLNEGVGRGQKDLTIFRNRHYRFRVDVPVGGGGKKHHKLSSSRRRIRASTKTLRATPPLSIY